MCMLLKLGFAKIPSADASLYTTSVNSLLFFSLINIDEASTVLAGCRPEV